MEIQVPAAAESLPQHKEKLENLCRAVSDDERIVGVIVVGSLASGEVDIYSDLDTKIVIEDPAFDEILTEAARFVSYCGAAVAHFTAEHVGFPEMTIALYDDLVHVDLHFVRWSDIPTGWTGLPYVVAYERGDRLSTLLATLDARPAKADVAWFEARMWTWVWYTQSKILRGELYEALDAVQYLRGNVLFPLLATTRGIPVAGSRRAERYVADLSERFERTVPRLDRPSLMEALQEIVSIYREFADPLIASVGGDVDEDARAVVSPVLEAGLAWEPD